MPDPKEPSRFAALPLAGLVAALQFGPPGVPPPFDDHAEMMKKLGLK